MDKILGMPRNAAIVLGAAILAVLAMALGLLIPWGHGDARDAGNADRPDESSSRITATPEAPVTPIKTPGPMVPAQPPRPLGTVMDVSKEPSLAGLKATPITVNFDNLQTIEALAAFSSQTSYALNPNVAPNQALASLPMSMHLQDAPLLEGIFEMLHTEGAVPLELSAINARLSFSPFQTTITNYNPDIIGRWCLAGPFAMVISHIDHIVDIMNGGARAEPRITLGCSLYAEPALDVVRFPEIFTIEELVDDKNQPIGTRFSRMGLANQALPRVAFTVTMTPAAERGERIARMRVRANFIVAPRVASFHTTDPSETINDSAGGMDVRIGPIVAGDNHSVEIRYSKGKMDAAQWEQFRPLLPDVLPVLFNANGNRMPYLPSASTREESPDAIVVHVSIPAAGVTEPHHLQITVPLEMREVSVPFEFHDLILP